MLWGKEKLHDRMKTERAGTCQYEYPLHLNGAWDRMDAQGVVLRSQKSLKGRAAPKVRVPGK